MRITKDVRKNGNVIYISIPKSIANLLNIDKNSIIELDIIKVYKK